MTPQTSLKDGVDSGRTDSVLATKLRPTIRPGNVLCSDRSDLVLGQLGHTVRLPETFSKNADPVDGVLLPRAPREILNTVVGLVSVQMVDFRLVRRGRADERFCDDAMNADVVVRTISVDQASKQVAVSRQMGFEHLRASSSTSLSMRVPIDTSFGARRVEQFKAGDRSPFLHPGMVSDLVFVAYISEGERATEQRQKLIVLTRNGKVNV